MLCSECGCEFVIEPGDSYHVAEIVNTTRDRKGTITGTETIRLGSGPKCPECGDNCSKIVGHEFVPV